MKDYPKEVDALMDKLRALTVFRRVVELESFQGVAKDLKLSKAAITKNIAELESAMGVPLINRTTRQFSVTEAGQKYYREVCDALDTLDQAEQNLFFNKSSSLGKLKIGAPLSLGVTLINQLICAFSDAYPNIAIEVVMDDKQLDLVSQGVDVAIRAAGEMADSSLKSRKLADLTRTLCASPQYLAQTEAIHAPMDLLAHQCLGYSLSSSNTWCFSQGSEKAEVIPKMSNFTVNNSLALVQAACRHKGVLLTLDLYVDQQLNTGELVQVLPNWQAEPRALYAVYPSSRTHSKLVRHFIDFLLDQFAS
ncbi:LysR family transcriptional regulator [Marinomonas epiphytica]